MASLSDADDSFDERDSDVDEFEVEENLDEDGEAGTVLSFGVVTPYKVTMGVKGMLTTQIAQRNIVQRNKQSYLEKLYEIVGHEKASKVIAKYNSYELIIY